MIIATAAIVFMLLFFLLQNAQIAMIFDDAIYVFIYFLPFISMLLRPSPSPILQTIQKMGERNEISGRGRMSIELFL